MGEIKRQSINNSFFSYIGAALGFLLIYIQPQLISASDIGLIRLLNSFSWMAAVIMPLGIGSITVRFFPKIRNPENIHNGFFTLIFIIASAGAFVVAGLLYLNKAFFIDYYSKSPEFPLYFNEALVFAYILSLVTVFGIYSSSLLKTTITVFLTDVFTRVGQLVVVLLYHYQVINKDFFVIGYISIFLVQLILLVLYLFRSKSVSFKINYAFYKTLDLKDISLFGLLMMATAFASLGIKFIDQLMIGHFLSAELVGIYATCVMMCVIMEIPFNSLERIANPKIANAWNNKDAKEVEKIYEMSSRYLFFIGGVLFCLLWAGIDLIFEYLPRQYGQGKIPFYIVSCASLFNLFTGVNSTVILYSHKYFAGSIFLFVLIAVSYIANNLLIPLYGISGAAMAFLIAIVAFNSLKYIYILIRFQMQPLSRHTVYILISILLSILLISLLPDSLNIFLRTALGVIIVGVIFSVMNIKFQTIEEVNKVLRRFKVIR